MRVQRRLAGVPESVAQARRFAIGALVDLPDDIVNDVEVMVSELATNALVHAATSFAVTIDRREHLVYVEVTDAGVGMPTRRSPAETEPHGRGLAIVEGLSDQWGTIHNAGEVGKSVWFTLNLPLGAERTDAPMAHRSPVPDPPSVTPAAAADGRGGPDALEAPSAPGSMSPIRDRIGNCSTAHTRAGFGSESVDCHRGLRRLGGHRADLEKRESVLLQYPPRSDV